MDSKLNDYEKDLLLQLSYLDIDKKKWNGKPISIKKMLDKVPEGFKKDRYNEVKSYIENNPNSPLNDLVLVDYENHNSTYKDGTNNNNANDNSGLVAYAFQDSSGSGICIYRGSEANGIKNTIADWGSNVLASFGLTISQQKQALEFYNKNKVNFNETLLMGHSKGGNLTAYVYLESLKDNVKTYILNGQPINWWGLTSEEKNALKSDRFTFNVIDGDFVSWLGFSMPYIDKYIKFNENADKGLFNPHYENNAQYTENKQHIVEKNPYKDFKLQMVIAIAATSFFTSINRDPKISNIAKFFAYTATISEKVSKFIINVYTKGKEIAVDIINSVSNSLAKLANKGKELAESFKNGFKNIQSVILSKIKGINKFAKISSGISLEGINLRTEDLNAAITKLNNVQRRISIVDNKLSALRRNANLDDKVKIALIDLKVGQKDYDITKIILYLDKAINELSKCERQVLQWARSI